MKEIEFRGKHDVRGWVYGYYYVPVRNLYLIVERNEVLKPMEYCILPETVGQYTGLKDKNGKKIYEGDIVRRLYGVNYPSKRHPSFKNNTAKINIAVIEYDIENGGYSYLSSPGDYNFQCEYEVIGNIYDNDIDALTHKYCKNEPDFSDYNDPF